MSTFVNNFRTGYKLECDVITKSQNVSQNSSVITVNVYLTSTGSSYTIRSSVEKAGSIDVNGVNYGFGCMVSLNGNQRKLLHSVDWTIYHDSAGNASVSISATVNLAVTLSGVYWGEVTVSGTHTLPTIPRKTGIVSVSGTTIGGNMTVDIDKKSSSFTSRVYIHVPGHDWYYITETSSDPISFTIPNGLANQIANATGITARLIIRTMNGGTQVGDNEYSFWLQVPSWMAPSISNVQADTDHQINGQWLWVKDKSKLRIRTTASGSYGSSITECKVTYDGVDYWGTDVYTGIQRNSETRTVSVTVKDSRGRTASWSRTIYVYPYQPPWGSITAYRCNEYGQRNDTEGTYIKVAYNGDKSSVNGANTFALAIDHRETGKEWSPNDIWHGEPVGYASAILGTPTAAYDIDKTYEVRLKVSDWYTTTYYTIPISTANVLMDFRRGGTGVGIGMMCTDDNTVQTNKALQLFAGRNGDPGIGADLTFCNVSNENQRIGINGGVPSSDHLLNVYRHTSSSSGNQGLLAYIDKWNNCHHAFNNNYFWYSIFFDPYATSHENVIRSRYSQCYFFLHNPNGPNNSHDVGVYHTNVGGVWEYKASSRQLLLRSGYGTISDERTKYDFNEFENWDDYYNFYMSLKPKTFKYINDTREETHIGMIAQEVADSIVENNLNNEKLCLVKCSPNEDMDDGRQYALAYQELISLNIKMIQKHEKEILELKSIIAQQQELIDKISGGV